MTRRLAALIACVLLLPATCFALLIGGAKEPIGAKNFEDWSGLADVVNDAARESYSWCNGSWWLSYRGDVAALNRVLRELAEVDAEQRPVVLLPMTSPVATQDGGAKRKSAEHPDWRLHVVQGAVRGMRRRFGTDSLDDVHPTLWVYVSERLPLESIEIPKQIQLLQAADIRQRYVDGVASENERARDYARQALERFESGIPRDGPAAEDYQARLTAIAQFVSSQSDEHPGR